MNINKRGISLIVLVITIIIMIIIAGAIILSLNGSGIIGRAHHATDGINAKSIIENIEFGIANIQGQNLTEASEIREELNKHVNGTVLYLSSDYSGIDEILYDLEGTRYRLTREGNKSFDVRKLDANENTVSYARLKSLSFKTSGNNRGVLIDTGIVPTEDMKIVIKVEDITTRENWGAEIIGTLHWRSFMLLAKQPGYDWYNGNESYVQIRNIGRGVDVIECTQNSLKINGKLYEITNPGDYAETTDTILIGTYSTIRPANFKFYYMKIYDGDELVRDFIPVKDSNQNLGLYDYVTQQIFYNCQGSDYVGEPAGSFSNYELLE